MRLQRRISENVLPFHTIIFISWNWNSLDETLVNAHLVEIPGLGTLTVGGLAGVDLEVLGRQTDGALDAEVLVK